MTRTDGRFCVTPPAPALDLAEGALRGGMGSRVRVAGGTIVRDYVDPFARCGCDACTYDGTVLAAPLSEVISAAAKRFDEKPLYRASIETREELARPSISDPALAKVWAEEDPFGHPPLPPLDRATDALRRAAYVYEDDEPEKDDLLLRRALEFSSALLRDFAGSPVESNRFSEAAETLEELIADYSDEEEGR